MTKPKKDNRAPGWVRSWDTDVPVGRTKHAFEDLMRRYGATGLTVSEDYTGRTVVVAFSLDPGGGRDVVEVHLPLGYDRVLDRLKRMPEFLRARDRRAYNTREQWAHEQAQRVGWRHLLLWAEAMLSAVDAGLYTLAEAVFAFSMLDTPRGKMPAIDAVHAAQRLARGA